MFHLSFRCPLHHYLLPFVLYVLGGGLFAINSCCDCVVYQNTNYKSTYQTLGNSTHVNDTTKTLQRSTKDDRALTKFEYGPPYMAKNKTGRNYCTNSKTHVVKVANAKITTMEQIKNINNVFSFYQTWYSYKTMLRKNVERV